MKPKSRKKKVICGLGTIAILPALFTGCGNSGNNYVLKNTELDETYVITDCDQDYIGIARKDASRGGYYTLIGNRYYAMDGPYSNSVGITVPVEVYMTDKELKQDNYDKNAVVDLDTAIEKRYEEDKENHFHEAKPYIRTYNK